eukprot:4704202-Pyramimonas_sp.AAC.1
MAELTATSRGVRHNGRSRVGVSDSYQILFRLCRISRGSGRVGSVSDPMQAGSDIHSPRRDGIGSSTGRVGS